MLHRWCDFWGIKRQNAFMVKHFQVYWRRESIFKVPACVALLEYKHTNILHDSLLSFLLVTRVPSNAHSHSARLRSAMTWQTTTQTLPWVTWTEWVEKDFACLCAELGIIVLSAYFLTQHNNSILIYNTSFLDNKHLVGFVSLCDCFFHACPPIFYPMK